MSRKFPDDLTDMEAIQAGYEDMLAGRVRPANEVFDEIEAKLLAMIEERNYHSAARDGVFMP